MKTVPVYAALLATVSGLLCQPVRDATATPTLAEIRGQGLQINTNRLKVTVTLDRAEYLPGEAATATVTILNPTISVLEVYEPFRDGPDRFISSTKMANGFGCCPTWPDASRILAAGETLSASFDSANNSKRTFGVPLVEGRYRLSYSYGDGQPVEFRVMDAVAIAETYIPIQGKGQYKDNAGVNREVALHIPAAVIQAEGKYYAVASKRPGGRILRDRQGKALVWASEIEPYVRIGESASPIISILGGHLKSGHTWAVQKRPTEMDQDKDIYSAVEVVG